MTTETKNKIDGMTYEQILRENRFHSSEQFVRDYPDDAGEYFCEALSKKKRAVGNSEAVAISKRIGW